MLMVQTAMTFVCKKRDRTVTHLPQQSAAGYKWLCQTAFCNGSLVFSSELLAAETVYPHYAVFLGIGAGLARGKGGEREGLNIPRVHL